MRSSKGGDTDGQVPCTGKVLYYLSQVLRGRQHSLNGKGAQEAPLAEGD